MISMKGVELPISTIIVIILVLIVLLAIVGLFYGVWPIGSQTATLESVKDNACQMLMSTGGCANTDHNIIVTKGIAIGGFDADQDGANDGGTTTTDNPKCKAGIGALPAEPNTHDSLFMLCECLYSITGSDDYHLDENCRTQVCRCTIG